MIHEERIVNEAMAWRFDRIPVKQQAQVIYWYRLNDWARIKTHFKKWQVFPAGMCTDCGIQEQLSEWLHYAIENGYIVYYNK